MFSIITSTLGIVAAVVRFVSLKRRRTFISRRHPTIASLVPITLWIGLSLTCGMLGFLTFWELNRISDFYYRMAITQFITNTLSILFTLIIIAVPSTSKCWLILRAIIAIPLATFAAAMAIWHLVKVTVISKSVQTGEIV